MGCSKSQLTFAGAWSCNRQVAQCHWCLVQSKVEDTSHRDLSVQWLLQLRAPHCGFGPVQGNVEDTNLETDGGCSPKHGLCCLFLVCELSRLPPGAG